MIAPGSIKICSLREPVHADYVAEAGADMFGLIFVRDAWRYVEPVVARQIVERARALAGDRIKAVGVFRGAGVDAINQIAEDVGLDMVQLSFPDLVDDLSSYTRPIIVTLRPEPGVSAEQVVSRVTQVRQSSLNVAGILLDAPSASGNGGLGELSDWHLAAEVARDHGLILAGGLTPENVEDAIKTVRPIGVDLSSGVETNRVKDPVKISAFVANARAAFAGVSIG